MTRTRQEERLIEKRSKTWRGRSEERKDWREKEKEEMKSLRCGIIDEQEAW